MNNKGKSGLYEVRLTTVSTQTSTWHLKAKSAEHAKKKMETINVGDLHSAEVDFQNDIESEVHVREITFAEVCHG